MVNRGRLTQVRWHAALTLAVVSLTTGCASTPASKPIDVAIEPWSYHGREGHKFVTDHFDIFSTLVDTELEAALPEYLEAAHQQYEALLPAEPKGRLQTYIFNDRWQWERFTKERFPSRYPVYRKITAGGYAEKDLCVVYYIRRMYTLSVLAHEGMHQYFAHHFNVKVPAWLNEGVATYCETFELPRGKPIFTPTRNTFRLNALRTSLASDVLLPLRDLLATNAGRVIDKGGSRASKTYYAQIWAMIAFLRHGADGQYADGFDKMMNGIVIGDLAQMAQAARIRAPSPAQTSYGEAVFRAYITEDFDTFERQFNDYIYELSGFRREEG